MTDLKKKGESWKGQGDQLTQNSDLLDCSKNASLEEL
jgi:hypothetical protein